MKMNTLLAKVEHGTAQFNKMIQDYLRFFDKSQGAFQGIKKTYKARDGYMDNPSKMGTTKVITTVDEKLDWFESQAVPTLKEIFSVEATNSRGAQTIELVVDGVSFGHLTALDLMRLKTLLTKKELEAMYSAIPVRSDAEVWEDCDDAEYAGREVYQSLMQVGVDRTTEKEEVILKDPNINSEKLPANYNAKTTIKSRTVEIGDYTVQKFTGEWTQRQRAELLRRRSQILAAVIQALKEVNDTESSQPNLDVEALINFLHNGK